MARSAAMTRTGEQEGQVTEVGLMERANRILAALDDKAYGQIKITEVKAEVVRDSEDTLSIMLFITLQDPAGESWPFRDVLKLRHEVWRTADEVGLMVPVYVRLAPESDPPQEDDEQTLFPT